ncbi:hypothetical protein [Aeromicrobium ginsengisoli]|uniref:Uncharacterized protein n=1 Tax=Aeromicrobium ginsengisoli TaxID=363867 RepID=A0A5M4FEU8_9ACTN|nr:hypothetical protein [Aeromicrobium ginsengisoli]KAA1397802.1 hypothetical protein ESP70_010680 [Aeromicrobium ginsengisoli]
MDSADFLTVDVFDRPPGGRLRWRRRANSELNRGIRGLRAATVNYSNNATYSLAPRLVPGGCTLVAAWDSPAAAEAAFGGRLRALIEGAGRFSLDGQMVRVKVSEEGDRWHGWLPCAEGAEPLVADEPMVAIVHGVLRRGHLLRFVRNNMHAASRAAHHPGHRGSVDISSQLPFEHTSISLWKTYALAQEFAYKPGGHATALKHALKNKTHRAGVFLQVRPLAVSGSLGIDVRPFPGLPPANRAGL